MKLVPAQPAVAKCCFERNVQHDPITGNQILQLCQMLLAFRVSTDAKGHIGCQEIMFKKGDSKVHTGRLEGWLWKTHYVIQETSD